MKKDLEKRLKSQFAETKQLAAMSDDFLLKKFGEELFRKFEEPTLFGAVIFQETRMQPQDAEIRRAFAEAGLNPRRPDHWKKLVEAFSKAHYSKPATRPIYWTDAELVRLAIHAELARIKRKLSSQKAIAASLRSHASTKQIYARYSVESLRKLMREAQAVTARYFSNFPDLDTFRIEIVERAKQEAIARGEPWTKEAQRGYEQLYREAEEVTARHLNKT